MDARPSATAPTVGDALLFSGRAAVSSAAAYALYARFLPIPGAIWAAVSALLVSQPSLHPSLRAALARCVANLVGAGIGSLCVALLGPGLAALAVAVVGTGLACHLARLDEALRPAYVAAAIVVLTLSGPAPSVWAASLDRLVAVGWGCAASVAVTLLFDLAWGLRRRVRSHVVPRQGETE